MNGTKWLLSCSLPVIMTLPSPWALREERSGSLIGLITPDIGPSLAVWLTSLTPGSLAILMVGKCCLAVRV